MMYAHQTYVPAPVQQSAPILSVDRMSTTALNLEQTVPLLHEAHTAKDILVGAYQSVQHQVPCHFMLQWLSPQDRGSSRGQEMSCGGSLCLDCTAYGCPKSEHASVNVGWCPGYTGIPFESMHVFQALSAGLVACFTQPVKQWSILQTPRGASMLQPRVPTSHSMPSASSAQQPQQRSSHALPSEWQQQQQLSQQMYAQRQRTVASHAPSQHPLGEVVGRSCPAQPSPAHSPALLPCVLTQPWRLP